MIGYTSIFKTLLALHEGDSNSSGSEGIPGSSLKTFWGSQSRLFPGMRLPLFPGSVNDDRADSGVATFLSNHVAPRLLQGPEPDDVEMTDAAVEETSSSTAKPAQSEEVSSASAGSSSLMPPLPSVALRSEIVFLKTGERRVESERQGTEANSEATRLRSELAIGSNDSGAETGLVTKRKREDEDDHDLGDADTRAQPRLKLDAVVPETTEQPLAEAHGHGSSVDSSSNLDEQIDTTDSSSAAASSDFSNVSNGDNSALNGDNDITNDQSNNDN